MGKDVFIARCYGPGGSQTIEIIICRPVVHSRHRRRRRYGAERKRTLAATREADPHHSRQLGIAHVYGKSDADAVFGMIYAQAEDDFNRIERNYLVSLGWLAQAEGESALYDDLRARLFIDVGRLQRQYRAAPAWLKSLDECLVGRLELLSLDAFGSTSEGHSAF